MVPVAVYLLLYRSSRVDQATIRNFRTLDAAAERVVNVLSTLNGVVDSSAFGISLTVLDEVTERITGRPERIGAARTGCTDDGGPGPLRWRGEDEVAFPDYLFSLPQPTMEQRREFAYRLAAYLLVQSNEDDKGHTERLWGQLRCLVETHRRFSSPVETIDVAVNPLPRAPLHLSPEHCAKQPLVRCDASLHERLASEECTAGTRSPRLHATARRMAATIVDCRPLQERSHELQQALKQFHGSEGVIHAIDLFGIQSTAQLDDLMLEATRYLSRFFDSHMIADSNGRILFEADVLTTPETETDESRVATPAFSNHVDISELLRAQSSSSVGGDLRSRDAPAGRAATVSAQSFRGQSFVETVRVEDVELRVFVHPFIMDGIDVTIDSEQTSEESQTSSTRTTRPTFYMVGIVDSSEFQSAAIKLRLSLVINATLMLLALLSLGPLLWFWTAGDRLLITGRALACICATPAIGIILLAVLACGVVTNRMDAYALDSTMEHLSDRIVDLFDRELHSETFALRQWAADTLQTTTEPDRGSDDKLEPSMNTGGRRQLSQLEKEFYCDDSERKLPYESSTIGRTNMLLLNDEGHQLVCRGDGALTRTGRLNLEFRAYFRRPKEGVLWRPTIAQFDPRECRGHFPQDEESLIPCIIDGLLEDVTLVNPGNSPANVAEIPYFLERIDSIVRGDVQTVLAVNTGDLARPVAVSGVDLNSLERTVPPQHIDFAVIDRRTGATLFHSDEELAMATNFTDDVGGAPELRSLLDSRTRDTISLVYAGIPIRAHVRPLRKGMPWALVVYRGHELEDRLTAVTTAFSIFYTLLWLFIVAFAATLVLLVAHCRQPNRLEGVPATVGRVMALGSRYTWTAAVSTGLPLLLLLSSHAWVPDGAWHAWRVLPFLAVAYVVAAIFFVLYCVLGERPTNATHFAFTIQRVQVLVALIIGLGAVPASMWFGYHRAAFSVGLHDYLVERTLESVHRAREDYRLAMLREFGGGATSDIAHIVPPLQAEREPDAGWLYGAVRSLMGFSKLSNELMVYRGSTPGSAHGIASTYGVFRSKFGYEIRPPLSGMPLGSLLTLLFPLLIIAGFVEFIAYSLCSICTVVQKRRHGLVRLPEARSLLDGVRNEKHLFGGPLRAVVLYRDKKERKAFLDDLKQKYGGDLRYEIDDLEEMLGSHVEGRARSKALDRAMNNDSPILVWSRVMADYRYSGGFGSAGHWGAYENDPQRRRQRSGLPCEFGSYVLRGRVLDESAFAKKLGEGTERNLPSCVKEVLWREATANPELLQVAQLVAADLVNAAGRTETSAMRQSESYRARAVTVFRKCASSYFSDLWARSTMDERLQLDALARGGVVDARRTATLSSLVNRGIVEDDNDTGVVRFRSEAFGEFVEHDIDHGELDAWRKEGGGGAWRILWPPLAIGAALGLAFLGMANPEIRTTLLTVVVGLLPIVLPFLHGGQGSGSTATMSPG